MFDGELLDHLLNCCGVSLTGFCAVLYYFLCGLDGNTGYTILHLS